MAETIQRDILTIYLEPNKPIRGAVARLDTLKLVITVKDADMNPVDLSDYRLVLTATDSEKTVFWDVYTIDVANGVIAAEVQPDVVGRNEYRLKVVLSDMSEVTFFVGALAVAVENIEEGPAATIGSMTARMLDAMERVELVQGPPGDKGDKGDEGDKGDKGDKGETGEVIQSDFDALRTTVEAINSMYVGTVFEFAAEIPPEGALVGDGALAPIADFSELFAVIGYAHTPDGTTPPTGYFYLPDYRDKFLRGHNPNGSRKFGSEQQDALQNIYGTLRGDSLTDYRVTGTGAFYQDNDGVWMKTSQSYVASTSPSIGIDASRIARTATETRPVNKTVLICIKY